MSENKNSGEERRRYPRFDTDLKLTFRAAFDLRTKVDFRIKETVSQTFSEEKFSGESRNINAEGICIVSSKQLQRKQFVYLEVYVPSAAEPIPMIGEVRWCKEIPGQNPGDLQYETGILLKVVEDSEVEGSIFFDQEHQMTWSVVLETVFSNFKNLAKLRKDKLQP